MVLESYIVIIFELLNKRFQIKNGFELKLRGDFFRTRVDLIVWGLLVQLKSNDFDLLFKPFPPNNETKNFTLFSEPQLSKRNINVMKVVFKSRLSKFDNKNTETIWLV